LTGFSTRLTVSASPASLDAAVCGPLKPDGSGSLEGPFRDGECAADAADDHALGEPAAEEPCKEDSTDVADSPSAVGASSRGAEEAAVSELATFVAGAVLANVMMVEVAAERVSGTGYEVIVDMEPSGRGLPD
jgi:hypothetical protein